MKTYGLFHGGGSYSNVVTNRDIEVFRSIQAAKNVFESRVDFDPYYPCTDESATMQLFFDDPRTDGGAEDLIDPGYPDRVLSIGPRGGVVDQRV